MMKSLDAVEALQKWTTNGHNVNILIVAEGITSRDKTRNLVKTRVI